MSSPSDVPSPKVATGYYSLENLPSHSCPAHNGKTKFLERCRDFSEPEQDGDDEHQCPLFLTICSDCHMTRYGNGVYVMGLELNKQVKEKVQPTDELGNDVGNPVVKCIRCKQGGCSDTKCPLVGLAKDWPDPDPKGIAKTRACPYHHLKRDPYKKYQLLLDRISAASGQEDRAVSANREPSTEFSSDDLTVQPVSQNLQEGTASTTSSLWLPGGKKRKISDSHEGDWDEHYEDLEVSDKEGVPTRQAEAHSEGSTVPSASAEQTVDKGKKPESAVKRSQEQWPTVHRPTTRALERPHQSTSGLLNPLPGSTVSTPIGYHIGEEFNAPRSQVESVHNSVSNQDEIHELALQVTMEAMTQDNFNTSDASTSQSLPSREPVFNTAGGAIVQSQTNSFDLTDMADQLPANAHALGLIDGSWLSQYPAVQQRIWQLFQNARIDIELPMNFDEERLEQYLHRIASPLVPREKQHLWSYEVYVKLEKITLSINHGIYEHDLYFPADPSPRFSFPADRDLGELASWQFWGRWYSEFLLLSVVRVLDPHFKFPPLGLIMDTMNAMKLNALEVELIGRAWFCFERLQARFPGVFDEESLIVTTGEHYQAYFVAIGKGWANSDTGLEQDRASKLFNMLLYAMPREHSSSLPSLTRWMRAGLAEACRVHRTRTGPNYLQNKTLLDRLRKESPI